MTKQELRKRATHMVEQHDLAIKELCDWGIDINTVKQDYVKGKYEYFKKHLDTVFNRRTGYGE